jgi:hypothetical protein
MRRVMILSVGLMLALTSATTVAAQGAELPFTGAVHGYGMVEPDSECPPLELRSVVTATGYVSEMGMIELVWCNCTPEGADIEGPTS